MEFELSSCSVAFFCQVTWAGFCSADVNPVLWLALLLHRDPWHLPQGYGFWWRNQAPVHFRELVIVMWKLYPLKLLLGPRLLYLHVS